MVGGLSAIAKWQTEQSGDHCSNDTSDNHGDRRKRINVAKLEKGSDLEENDGRDGGTSDRRWVRMH